MHEFIVCLITFCHILAELSAANGISLFANISDKFGNGIQLPTAGHQNESKLLNITGNKLNPEPTTIGATVYKTPTTNYSLTHSISGLLEGSEGRKANISKNATTLPTSLSTMESTTKLPTTHLGNYTTTSPPHGFPRHHFNMKLLDYIIIPIGCVLAIVISYFLVRHVQKVRRKRRLERELFHQYSYPNSEADDMEEQNIGEIESVINAQFVSFNDRSDKNLYEDSSVVNLAFDETSKLVVQDPPPASPDELEASTSFNT